MTQQTFKWLKRLTLVLAIIPILIFLAFAGAVSLIDFNQYKPQIEKEISELTQRELKIEGAVDVSILPFMFNVGKLSLKNPKGFPEENLLTLEEANIELSLRKLFLDKRVEIISLELIEPHLHFFEMTDKNNWSDIPLLASLFNGSHLAALALNGQQFNPEYLVKTSSSSSTEVTEVTEDKNQDWFLESLVIQNAEISYTNQPQDFQVDLKQANLITFDVRPGEIFKINSDFIYVHSQSPRTFEFEINADLRLDNNYTQAHLSDWSGVFRLQLPAERNLPDIRLTTTGKNLMVDFQHQQIYVKDALLKGLESEVITSFQGEFGVDPAFQGVFSAAKINIKNWIEHLGLPAPEMASEKALKNAGGKFNFSWDGKVLKLENIEAELDESKVTGQVELPIVGGTYRFALQVTDFNADQYMMVSANGGKFYPLPAYDLYGLEAEGDLTFSNASFSGVNANEVQIRLSANNGRVELAPFDLFFKQGRVLSKLGFESKAASAGVSWKGRVDEFQLSQLGLESVIEGMLNSRFDLTAEGAEWQQWLSQLHGSLQMTIEPAQLRGVDVNQVLSGELSLAGTQGVTSLKSFSAVGSVEKGVFLPKRFKLAGRGFSGSGIGKFDLAEQRVEGELKVLVHDDPESTSVMQALQGKVVPIQFSGDLQNPKWALATNDLFK